MLDLALALTYVALDRTPAGQLASRTPARVDEDGPWWDIAVNAREAGHDAERARRELEERRAEHRARLAAIDACNLCEPSGYLPNGRICRHDPDATPERAQARALPARVAAEAARERFDARLREAARRYSTVLERDTSAEPTTDGDTVTDPAVPEFFTVIDNVLRGDGKGTHHAAIVGPGVLCGRTHSGGVEAVEWEHGVANVDCPRCLEALAREQASR